MPLQVLIVDDRRRELLRYEEEFRRRAFGHFTLHTATTLEGAAALFAEISPDIIVVDGCVPGDELNSIPFIKMVLEYGFEGMLVAASSSPAYRETMVREGCTHQAAKHEVVRLILREIEPN